MKNWLRKLHCFLEKIDFFVTLMHVAWSVGVVFYSVTCRYRHFIYDIPEGAVIVFLLLCIGMGVFLQKRFFSAREDKAAFIGYQVFYFGIPIMVGIVRTFVLDDFYSFSGGFMPGLEALGLLVFGWILGGIALVALAVFWGIRLLSAYRRKKGKTWNLDFWKKFKYVLNVILFWGMVGAALFMLTGNAVVYCNEAMHDKEIQRNEAYLEKRVAKLRDQMGEKDQEGAEYMLEWEGYVCCLLVESLSQEPEPAMDADLESMLEFACLPEEVLWKGVQDYREFLTNYQLVKGVEMLQQELRADAKARTISVCSAFDVVDEEANSLEEAYLIVTLDEAWNIVEIKSSLK